MAWSTNGHRRANNSVQKKLHVRFSFTVPDPLPHMSLAFPMDRGGHHTEGSGKSQNRPNSGASQRLRAVLARCRISPRRQHEAHHHAQAVAWHVVLPPVAVRGEPPGLTFDSLLTASPSQAIGTPGNSPIQPRGAGRISLYSAALPWAAFSVFVGLTISQMNHGGVHTTIAKQTGIAAFP